MSIQAIEVEFASRGTRAGGALLLEEKVALAMIDRAAQLGIPVRAVDQVRPDALDSYATIKGEVAPPDQDSWTTWGRAREFIRSLGGRGLLFEIVLEDPPRTPLVQAKGFITAADNRTFLISAIAVIGMATTIILVLMSGSLLR